MTKKEALNAAMAIIFKASEETLAELHMTEDDRIELILKLSKI